MKALNEIKEQITQLDNLIWGHQEVKNYDAIKEVNKKIERLKETLQTTVDTEDECKALTQSNSKQDIRMRYSFGNSKLPTSTIIINMSSAEECPMRHVCPFAVGSGVEGKDGKCYALKAARMYPNVKESRKFQTEYWRTTDNFQKLADFNDLYRMHPRKMPTVTAVRFNESGDMRGAEDLAFLIMLAIEHPELEVYTYTHNEELMRHIDATKLPDNLTINLSYRNDKEGFNTFCADVDYDGAEDTLTCPGDCKICSLCQESKGLNIAVAIH